MFLRTCGMLLVIALMAPTSESMKKFYLCKLCVIGFGAFLAVQRNLLTFLQ